MSWNHTNKYYSHKTKILVFSILCTTQHSSKNAVFSLSISRHDRCLVTYSHGVTQRAWCLRNASQAPALRLGIGTMTGPTFVGHRAVEVQETALFCHGPFTARWTSLFTVVILSTSFTLYGYRYMYSWEYEYVFLSIVQKTKFTVYLLFKASMSVLYLTMNELNIIRHFSNSIACFHNTTESDHARLGLLTTH